MRRFVKSALFVMLTSASVLAFAASKSTAQISFVQTASSAVLTKTSASDNTYTLSLTGIGPYVTYYMHRPSRTTGLALTSNFLKAWSVGNNDFKTDPPNAVLYGATVNGADNNSREVYFLTLSNPSYQKLKATESYDVKPLDNKSLALSSINLTNAVLVIN